MVYESKITFLRTFVEKARDQRTQSFLILVPSGGLNMVYENYTYANISYKVITLSGLKGN
jgi:hypothetical protein